MNSLPFDERVSNILLRNMVEVFFDILRFLIFARIILSFFPVNPHGNPTFKNVIQFIHMLTEPILAPFRSLIPPLRVGGGGYLDLSPIIAIIVLNFVRRFVLGFLAQMF